MVIAAPGTSFSRTIEGRDLSEMWAELQATIDATNARRSSLVSLLSSTVSVPAEDVPQGVSGGDFEEASEFGVPKSMRSATDILTLGYSLRWYDVATRFTFKFLLDATAAQGSAVHNSVLEADNRLVFSAIMRAVLNPTRRTNEQGNTIYGAYAGVAGPALARYLGTIEATTVDIDALSALADSERDRLRACSMRPAGASRRAHRPPRPWPRCCATIPMPTVSSPRPGR